MQMYSVWLLPQAFDRVNITTFNPLIWYLVLQRHKNSCVCLRVLRVSCVAPASHSRGRVWRRWRQRVCNASEVAESGCAGTRTRTGTGTGRARSDLLLFAEGRAQVPKLKTSNARATASFAVLITAVISAVAFPRRWIPRVSEARRQSHTPLVPRCVLAAHGATWTPLREELCLTLCLRLSLDFFKHFIVHLATKHRRNLIISCRCRRRQWCRSKSRCRSFGTDVIASLAAMSWRGRSRLWYGGMASRVYGVNIIVHGRILLGCRHRARH